MGTRLSKQINTDLPEECKVDEGVEIGANQNQESKPASHLAAVGVDKQVVDAGTVVDKATATVGWVGCGTMGKSQVGHLIKCGYKVFVWNRTKENAKEAVDAGA